MIDALVIGASGGIGRAVAAEMTARGGNVTRLSRRENGLDVTDPASVARVMGALEGPFQTVFVSVGILAPEGRGPEKQLAAIDAAAMARVFAVNTVGVALILSHLPRLLPKTGTLRHRRPDGAGGLHRGQPDRRLAFLPCVEGRTEPDRAWRCDRAGPHPPGRGDRGAPPRHGRHALHRGLRPQARKGTPEEAAKNLCDVMERLTPAQSGGFFDYAGREIPW
jgi:hypothetical protein